MPLMLEKSRIWNLSKQAGEATQSLRQTLFQTFIQEMITRVGKIQFDRKDDELVNSLITKGVITSDLKWQYLAWDAKAMTLKPTKQEAISSTEMSSILQRLSALSANPHLIHRVAALRPLRQDSIPQDAMKAVPWKLEISLRSAEANELHALIQRLVGNGITQLILVRISPTGLQRSPLAVALSQRLKG